MLHTEKLFFLPAIVHWNTGHGRVWGRVPGTVLCWVGKTRPCAIICHCMHGCTLSCTTSTRNHITASNNTHNMWHCVAVLYAMYHCTIYMHVPYYTCITTSHINDSIVQHPCILIARPSSMHFVIIMVAVSYSTYSFTNLMHLSWIPLSSVHLVGWDAVCVNMNPWGFIIPSRNSQWEFNLHYLAFSKYLAVGLTL